MTTTPWASAMGANFLLISPPAEKKAKSRGRSKEVSSRSSTVYSVFFQKIFSPAERGEEKRDNELIGN